MASKTAEAPGGGTAVLRPRRFPTRGFELINPAGMVEEKKLPTFCENGYYPMRIGEVICNRYQVAAELGYGVSSTVWLCRDLTYERKYWTLKVHAQSQKHIQELEIFQHLEAVAWEPEAGQHPGLAHIRRLEESITIDSPYGQHVVYEPQDVPRPAEVGLVFDSVCHGGHRPVPPGPQLAPRSGRRRPHRQTILNTAASCFAFFDA